MKKYFLLAAAAATVLAVSCNKEKNQPTTDPTPNVVEEIDETTPQPMLFGTNVAVVKSPITKGLGAIDTWSTSQTLYIYGLKRTAQNADTYDWDDIKIDNIGATAPDGIGNTGRDNINVYDPANTRYKASADADDSTAKLPTEDGYDANTMTVPVPGYFYYDEGAYYDFYGYYVDDATGYTNAAPPALIAPNPTVADSKIVLSNLTIDGTQDIMLAENASAGAKMEDIMWRADQSKAVTIADLYSAKSARRDVVPNLHFEHQLSRFVFNVVKADNTVVSEVEDLTIESHNKATLTIAGEGRGIAFTSDAPVDLKGKKNDAFTFGVKPDANASVPASALYADIMVEPGKNKYPFSVYISQPGTKYTSTDPYEVELEVDFGLTDPANAQSAPILAQAGKKYVVNVVVYGLEKILITVSLAEWDEVEFGWVDPDKKGEAEDTRKLAALTLQAQTVEDTPTAIPGSTATAATIASGAQAKISIASATWGDTPTNITGDEFSDLTETAYFKSSNINVAKVDKRTGVVTAVAAGEATITVTVNDAAYYGTATFVITVTAPLPKPEFAGAPGNITIDQSDLTSQNFVADLFTSCQYNSTDVAAEKISIELKDVDGSTVDASVSSLFDFNATAKTVTVAANSDWTKVSSVKKIVLKAAASDGVHQAADNVEITVNTQE